MKNEYKVTKKLMMSWVRESYFINGINIVIFILYCALGIADLAMTAFFIVNKVRWTSLYLSVFILILLVYRLVIYRFLLMSNRYKMLSKTYGVSEWLRTTEFTDEEIILFDHTSVSDFNSVSKFKYDNIKKIVERNKFVMIFFNSNLSIRLYKDAFVESSWEECKEKINSMLK